MTAPAGNPATSNVSTTAPIHLSADAWRQVEQSAAELFVDPPLAPIRINIAAFLAHGQKDLCPAWVLTIAPPGSGKTELDDALDQFPNVWAVDQLTPNTLLSGQIGQSKRRKPASLLHRIGPNGIIVVKDLSSYLSNRVSLSIIMGQLRRVHDGAFRPEFGTQDDIKPWKGRITLFASITPEIDSHISVLNKMGPRFVFVRWPRAGGIETGRRVAQNRTAARARFQAAVRSAINSGWANPPALLTDEQATTLSAAGELVALARGTVHRDSVNREVDLEAVVEGNTRLTEQLVQIAKGSAKLEGRTVAAPSDIALAVRAAADTIPSLRWKILRAIDGGRSPYSVRGVPEVLASRATEELEMLGVIEGGESWRMAGYALSLGKTSGIFQAADSWGLA
jgi:hypothetical protein